MTTPDQRSRRAPPDPAAAAGRAQNFRLRIASAAVLVPLALGSAYVGGWWFLALWALAAAAILFEWTHLVTDRIEPRILAPGLAGLLAALLLTGLGEIGGAVIAIAAGALLAGGAAFAGGLRPPLTEAATGVPAAGLWAGGGVIYAGCAFVGPAFLRRDPELGFVALLLLFATVWATDVFALFCGRAIGGPLLFRQVSPNKTWAGAIGGLIGGLAAAVAVAYASGIGKLAVVGVVGLVLSVLSQAGDLFESAVKRHFGAKDASRLIPGHGGLMDRLDGFLIAALAALVIGILRQGTDAPAQGLLLW